MIRMLELWLDIFPNFTKNTDDDRSINATITLDFEPDNMNKHKPTVLKTCQLQFRCNLYNRPIETCRKNKVQ